jgi:hypothetical protein
MIALSFSRPTPEQSAKMDALNNAISKLTLQERQLIEDYVEAIIRAAAGKPKGFFEIKGVEW